MNSLRQFTQSPRYSLLAVALIGIGIGACTAVFSLFDSLILRDRPGIVDGDRLADLGRTVDGAGFDNFSYLDYLDYRDRNSTFEDLAALDYSPTPVGLSVDRDAQSAHLQWVSANYFKVLDTRFAAGRGFRADEPLAPEIVLSHRYWQRRFQGDPGAVGRSVLLNGVEAVIVGIAEPGFTGSTILTADVWAPVTLLGTINPGNTTLQRRLASLLVAIGRLKPGVTLEQAQADLSVIARAIAQAHPDTHASRGVAVAPSGRFVGQLRQMAPLFLGILGLLAGLILLVAGANIAGLMLARGVLRQREFAVRSALGADRARLLRQLLAEHLVLFAAGGAVGIVVCLWLVDAFAGLVPGLPMPLELAVSVSPAVFAFAFGFSLLVGLLFSLGPALSSSRFDLLTVLRRGEQPPGGRRFSLRSAFLVLQLTFSLALLVTAGALAKSLLRLTQQDPGFDPRRVEFAQVDLATAGLNRQTSPVFLDTLLAAAQELPALESAAYTVAIPLDGAGHGFGRLTLPENRDGSSVRTDWNLVSPDYFSTLKIPLVQGRAFLPTDRAGMPLVGIVNETLARQLWPGQDAVGQVLLNAEGRPVEIVGVARDAKYRYLGESPRNHFYAPLAQVYTPRISLIYRTRSDASAAPDVRALVRQLQPNLPVYHTQDLTTAGAASLLPQRIAAGSALTAGVLALILAALGVYGVTLYWTAARTREFGVRVALGATRRHLVLLALGSSFRLGALAAVLGLAAAFGLGQVIRSLFTGVQAADPLLFALGAAFFLALVLLAAWFPARRAARVDPMTALRAE